MAARLVSLTDAGSEPVRRVVHGMRALDRAHGLAMRWNDDREQLVEEIMHSWGKLAWVVFDGTVPYAVFGAVQTWPGVWTAWLIATEDFKHVSLFVTRFVLRRLIPLLKSNGAHRCEVLTMAEHPWAHRWLEALGGTREATLTAYGRNREDFAVYRWLA